MHFPVFLKQIQKHGVWNIIDVTYNIYSSCFQNPFLLSESRKIHVNVRHSTQSHFVANPIPAIFIGPRRHVSVAKSHRNLKKCLAATWGIRRDVDGNSGLGKILANVMEEIPHQLIWSISHYLQGFKDGKWMFAISEPSTVSRWWIMLT